MSELTITKETFDEMFLKADKPAFFDSWTERCGYCKTLGHIVKEVAYRLLKGWGIADFLTYEWKMIYYKSFCV